MTPEIKRLIAAGDALCEYATIEYIWISEMIDEWQAARAAVAVEDE